MKKLYSFVLIFALIIVLAVPVSAADDSAWVELLEFTSVNDSGQYIFSFTNSGTMNFTLPQQMRLRRVDILISTPANEHPSAVTVTANSQTFSLTVNKISSELIRVSGYVPNTLYTTLSIQFTKSISTRSYYQVLSCKVSGIGMQEYQASADVAIENVIYPTGTHIDLVGQTPDLHAALSYTTRINVYDWEKFDQITVWGSVKWGSIDSVRATLGTAGLAMETNFFQFNDAGSWTEIILEHRPAADAYLGDTMSTPFYGDYLYCITIDLANVDRTSTEPIYIYMTGHYDSMYGATFNCQYVNGSVYVADTSSMTWYQRFTNFLSDLFGEGKGEESVDALDDSSASISQGTSDIESFEQQQQSTLNSGFSFIQAGISFTSFSTALLFVQKYANMAFSGISKYALVFTLPLFLGLFFYLCSRIPGVTRWKPRPRQPKGGEGP